MNMKNSEESFLRIFLQDDNHETDEWIDLKHKDQSKSDMIKNTNSHTVEEYLDRLYHIQFSDVTCAIIEFDFLA